jgi:hypothetical protein
MAAAIVARDYLVDLGEWFSRAWRLCWRSSGCGGGFGGDPGAWAWDRHVSGDRHGGDLPLGFVLWGSLGWLFLKRIRGERADMGDAFAGFTLAFVPLMLGGLVIQALTTGGLGTLHRSGGVSGGDLVGIRAVVDHRQAARFLAGHGTEPQGGERALVAGGRADACVVAVGLSGLLFFGSGIFLTMPLAVAASVYAYEDIFGKLDPGA